MNSKLDAQPIVDLIEGFRRSKTMFTAVNLGIFDRLAAAPASAPSLAERLSLNPAALERLLDGCAALGLIERDGDRYGNSKIAERFLTKDSPETLAGYIRYSDQSLYKLWGHLDDAVREGTNRWTQVFGGKSALFDFYFRDEAATRSFLAGMHGFGQISSPRVVRAFDLKRFRHLVDLGGATGHLSIAACEVYPDLKATVFDLPAVEPFAREYIGKARLASRIDFVAGDFFADALPDADLYMLGRILHDWDEAKIGVLLRKVFDSLPQDGALLVGEILKDEDRNGPVRALMQDLNMLVCTDGQERTESEYAALLGAAGFVRVGFARTGAVLDAILAEKV